MKRLIAILFIAGGVLALSAGAAEKQYSYAVKNALLSALQNERQAALRYDACAAKADADGYPGAASLFRALAKGERVHEQRFASALQRGGVPLPENNATTPEVGTTAENLRASASAEQSERDNVYRQSYEVAVSAKDEEMAKLFDVTRDAETEHGNLCSSAARELSKLKEPRSYYVCSKCGYVSDFTMSLCPSCREQHALEETR